MAAMPEVVLVVVAVVMIVVMIAVVVVVMVVVVVVVVAFGIWMVFQVSHIKTDTDNQEERQVRNSQTAQSTFFAAFSDNRVHVSPSDQAIFKEPGLPATFAVQ